MIDKYVSVQQELEIRHFKEENVNILIVSNPIDATNYTINEFSKKYYIDSIAVSIIRLMDGTRTYKQIIHQLAKQYNDEYNNVDGKVQSFYSILENSYNIHIIYSDTTNAKQIKYVDGKMYPTVASIELTTKCNFKCLHCYGEYSPANNTTMSFENAKKLLVDLKNMGISIIEFTGGEITVYPHLQELVEEAFKNGFFKIGLLTNGYALSDSFIDFIIKHKDKLFVQVDLHSLRNDYWEWFTQIKNVRDRILNNIERLAKNGVFMRIAVVVTPKNIDELEEIADVVYNLGIGSLGCSAVIKIGRAEEGDNDLLITDITTQNRYIQTLENISAKYPNFIFRIEYGELKHPNCGSITSNVSITPNGDIKYCTMDNLEYFNTILGNVFEMPIKDIYDKNREYVSAIYATQPPNPDDPQCMTCKYRFFCSSCILRGCIGSHKIMEEGGICNWYNNISPIVKRKLFV